MKKFCLVFLSAVTAVVASAQTSPLITKPLAEGTVSTVLSETSGGNILVTGVTGSFKAELYAVANNSKDKKLSEQELRDRLEKEYDVKMEVEFILKKKIEASLQHLQRELDKVFKNMHALY